MKVCFLIYVVKIKKNILPIIFAHKKLSFESFFHVCNNPQQKLDNNAASTISTSLKNSTEKKKTENFTFIQTHHPRDFHVIFGQNVKNP